MRPTNDHNKPTMESLPPGATEQRQAARSNIHTVVSIMPVDERGKIYGNRSIGTCRNISASGVSLLCKHAIGKRFLHLDAVNYAVGLSSVTIEVLREMPSAEGYEIAGRFVKLPLRTSHVLRS